MTSLANGVWQESLVQQIRKRNVDLEKTITVTHKTLAVTQVQTATGYEGHYSSAKTNAPVHKVAVRVEI